MATSEQEQDQLCHYLVRVKTGDFDNAGTDSNISLKLSSASGDSFTVNHLRDWGIMGPGHHYFYRGNLDIFFGRQRWLNVCAMTITSDGQGSGPGWYLDYVEVTTIRSNKTTKIAFPVNQWLDPTTGYQLSATADLCSAPA